jgi:hypothetical protein
MALSRQLSRDTMWTPSHTSDGTAEVTWPRSNVDVKSCWQRCCRVMMVTALLSPAGDGPTESCWRRCCQVLLVMALLSWRWLWHDVAAKGHRGDLAVARYRYRVMLTMPLPRWLGHSAMSLSSHAMWSESRSMTGAVMCDQSPDVPAL